MKKKKIGLWIRVSTHMQVDTESHIHQEMRAKEFIKHRGWKLTKTYRLEGLSGKSVMGYDETKRMLADIKNGVISGLVFWKISRLARNTKELIEISEIFNEHNADLISMDMAIDTSTSIGRHFFRQMASMVQWQREVIVENVKSSIKARAELGKRIGGTAPLGFSYDKHTLLFNEDEVPLVKLTFELYLQYKRKTTVAKMLNEQGYRTRNGYKFSGTSIGRIITNTMYKGVQIMNKRYSNPSWKLKPKEEWVFHKIPVMISPEAWEAANVIEQSVKKNHKRVLNTKVHLFTSFIFCQCGSKMSTRYNRETYLCFNKCGNAIYKEDLEEIFRSELHNYTVSEDEVKAYFSEIVKIQNNQKKQLDSLIKEKEKLEREIKNLLDLHQAGQIPTNSFKEHHEKPYEQLSQVKLSIESLKFDTSLDVLSKKNVVSILDKANTLYSQWNTLTHQQKREVIEKTTERIIVGKDSIEINLYKILPDFISFENATNGPHTPAH